MSQYQQWTYTYLSTLVREELMDLGAKWWSENELLLYVQDWVDDVQQNFNLTWGSCTLTISGNALTTLSSGGQFAPTFIAVSTMTPTPMRIEAFYWNGWRLAGRLLEDLEAGEPEWRATLPDSPRMVVQYDAQSWFLWPQPSYTGTLVCEYPIVTTAVTTNDTTLQVPFWAQYSAKPFICARAYAKPGPTNDLKKTLRYQKQYQDATNKIKTYWDGYNPYRYLKLKPAGQYEWDILTPPPAMGSGT